jgi:hypothetical protein
MKIMGSKIQLLTILGLIVLLAASMTAYGSGPAPGTGDPHLLGPAISGTVTFKPSDPTQLNSPLLFTFEGRCQGTEFTLEDMGCEGNTFAGVTEETLKEFFIFCVPLSFIPCVPGEQFLLDPTTPMVIHQVLDYEDLGSLKRAKILVLFLGN